MQRYHSAGHGRKGCGHTNLAVGSTGVVLRPSAFWTSAPLPQTTACAMSAAEQKPGPAAEVNTLLPPPPPPPQTSNILGLRSLSAVSAAASASTATAAPRAVASPDTSASEVDAAPGSQLHVRHVGGKYEDEAVLCAVFAQIAPVVQATVRHRIDPTTGENTSWALLTMETRAGSEAVMVRGLSCLSTCAWPRLLTSSRTAAQVAEALLPKPLTVTRYSEKQAAKSTGGMKKVKTLASQATSKAFDLSSMTDSDSWIARALQAGSKLRSGVKAVVMQNRFATAAADSLAAHRVVQVSVCVERLFERESCTTASHLRHVVRIPVADQLAC